MRLLSLPESSFYFARPIHHLLQISPHCDKQHPNTEQQFLWVAAQLSWPRRVSIHYCCVILIRRSAVASTQRAGFLLWSRPPPSSCEGGGSCWLKHLSITRYLPPPTSHICRQRVDLQLEIKVRLLSALSRPGGKIWHWSIFKKRALHVSKSEVEVNTPHKWSHKAVWIHESANFNQQLQQLHDDMCK